MPTAAFMTWDQLIVWGDILLRMGLAMAFGAILGLERQLRQKPAGLRTHMLVALGASTFAIIAIDLVGQENVNQRFHAEVSRVVAAVIGALGFLGAASIIRQRGAITGITTAATTWVVGAVGVACGLRMYPAAVIAVLFSFLILIAARTDNGNSEPTGPVGPETGSKQESEIPRH